MIRRKTTSFCIWGGGNLLVYHLLSVENLTNQVVRDADVKIQRSILEGHFRMLVFFVGYISNIHCTIIKNQQVPTKTVEKCQNLKSRYDVPHQQTNNKLLNHQNKFHYIICRNTKQLIPRQKIYPSTNTINDPIWPLLGWVQAVWWCPKNLKFA